MTADHEILRWHRIRDAMTADPGPARTPADRLLVIAAALFTRFERTQDDADLNAAIEAGQQAAAVTAPHHPDRAGILMFLGACLGLRYERRGDLADLTDAVRVAQEAVTATPPGHPDRATYETILQSALDARPDETPRVAYPDDSGPGGAQEATELEPEDQAS